MVQTAFWGDLLLTIPLLRWIKSSYPDMQLGLVCRKGLGNPLLKLGLVDQVWEIQKGNAQSYREIRSQISSYSLNLLLAPHTSVRTTLFCSRLKARRKITFAKFWNFAVFDRRLKWPGSYPEALRLLSMLVEENEALQKLWKALPPAQQFIVKTKPGDLPAPPEWADPHTSLDPKRVEKLSEELKILERFPFQNFIALFPGSVWATKMWKKEGYQSLGQELQQSGHQVVIMGGPDEKSLASEIALQIPGSVNLCGQSSLLESLLILQKARLVVGNDSSSSHMAALMGIPVVSIFGPTVLEFGYRPWAKQTRILELDGLSCRPCGLHGHRQCPLGHHKCMKSLEVHMSDLPLEP
ncbi:MAG: glycosyltransferase family 9 protein [Bdellovibrionales bacterium]